MPPLRRSGRTHSITTVSSSTSETRPTLADIPLAPRRRLRNGSASTTSSRSRGSSRSASATRGAGGGRMPTRLILRPPTQPALVDDPWDSESEVSAAPDDGDYEPRDDSLTPPPPAMAPLRAVAARLRPTPSSALPVANPASRSARDPTPPSATASDLLAQLDALPLYQPTPPSLRTDPPPRAPFPAEPFSLSRSPSPAGPSASGSSRSSDGETSRRFTRQEKGKGRAAATPLPLDSGPEDAVVEEINDESPGNESIQLIGIKRKVVEIDTESDLTELEDSKEEPKEQADGHAELEKLDTYMCPVCFSEPSNAVMTVCGHIFCSVCLSSSLLAAIGRDPTAHHYRPPARPPANRGRARIARNQARGAPPPRASQPTEWNHESLRTGYEEHREREFEAKMKSIGLAPEAWDLAREEQGMAGEVKVESLLKGLWKIDGGFVIEGECPVCRKGIPGGYASPELGLGGVIALLPRTLTTMR